MRRDTRQRERALAGWRALSGQDEMLGTLVRVIRSGKQALDVVMLEMGRMVAESVMLMEREEVAGPDYDPTDPAFKKWAHEEGSLYLGDQKVKVTRPLVATWGAGGGDPPVLRQHARPWGLL